MTTVPCFLATRLLGLLVLGLGTAGHFTIGTTGSAVIQHGYVNVILNFLRSGVKMSIIKGYINLSGEGIKVVSSIH